MPTVSFIGRTFPATVHVAITLPTVHWEDPETGLVMDFDAIVKDGGISIECRLNKFNNDEHMIPVHNRAFDIATAGLDLVSFATGRPFTVILESFVDPAGYRRPFGKNEPELSNFAKSVQPADFAKVFSIVIGEWPLFVALRDLIEAISLPHRGAANCARVVETLRTQMAGRGDTSVRSKGWEELRNNLRISREYLDFITDTSKGPRHGDHWNIKGSDLKEATTRTWIIMDRFLEYRKRGSRQLPLSEFPLLT